MKIKHYLLNRHLPYRYIIAISAILCLLIVATLWGFLSAVPALPSEKPASAWHDGEKQVAIILTGSHNRIEAGMQLLRTGQVDSLFISGVYPKLKLSELYHALEESPQACGEESLHKNCIELGRKATNTNQNACESMEWIKQNNINRFYLITSDYHYPRSHAEFVAILQKNDYETVILPYITRSDEASVKDWSSEYIKWLFVKSRIFLEKFLPKPYIMSCF